MSTLRGAPFKVKVYCLALAVSFNRERDGNRTPKGLLFGLVEVCGLLAFG
jgi:hypothetical protein